MTQLYTVAGGLAAFILALRLYFSARFAGSRALVPLPPGPKGLPLIGNLFDMPRTLEWKTYNRWAKEMKSDVIHLNVAGTSLIVLNTLEAAKDLLDKRSSIYSSRPRMPMVVELMNYNFLVVLMEYGERWRQHRRLVHQALLSPAAVHHIRPPTLKATRNLLKRFLDKPDDIMGNLKHMTGEIIISAAYGLDIQAEHDPYVELLERGVEGLTEAVIPGSFLVDMVPLLKYVPAWMPGAGFQRKAMKWKKLGQAIQQRPFEAAKARMSAGDCRPCMTSMFLEEMENGTDDVSFTEENIRNVVGTLYTVGADTTSSAMGSCLLGLVHHPKVVKRAQMELDRVIVPGHLPTFDDQPSLPYITAIVKEALRWNDVAPIGVPHLLTAEDEYKGYRLPAGSIVIPNCWAILHDEEVYPDPFTFNPARFMKGEMLDPDVQDPGEACWGFGRRICPGRHMAFSTLWMAISSLLTVYDIKKKVDGDGNVVNPGYEYLSSIICTPQPFIGSITPRSKAAESLIRSSASQDGI